MRDYVLYHAHCSDGFGAAWAAWKRLGETATYVPVRHGVPPPPLPNCARLFLVDFAYPAEQLVQLSQSVSHITVLDHHKSARAALADIRTTSRDDVVVGLTRLRRVCLRFLTWMSRGQP